MGCGAWGVGCEKIEACLARLFACLLARNLMLGLPSPEILRDFPPHPNPEWHLHKVGEHCPPYGFPRLSVSRMGKGLCPCPSQAL